MDRRTADALEKQFYESVMDSSLRKVMGQTPVQGPNDDAKKDDDRRDRDSTSNNNSHNDRNPVVPDGRAFGLLGQSDLDPLGRAGTGNVFDPRGGMGVPFPSATEPGTIPPGARFDPSGPVNPNPPQQRPGQGQGPGSFADPNPDHEKRNIDGYDIFM